MTSKLPKILAAIIDHCQPAELPSWLPEPRQVRGYWQLHSSSAELLADLQRTFSADELLRSGAVFRREHDPARSFLNPALVKSERTMIALTDARGEIYDLVAHSGCLRERAGPLFAAFGDPKFTRRLLQTNCLILTASVAAAAALTSLGLAATTMAGLERLGGENLIRFKRLWPQVNFYPYKTDPYRDWNGGTISVIVAAWNVSLQCLDEPAGVDSVIVHLQRLHEQLGLDIDAVRIWRPIQRQLDDFFFVVRHAQEKQRLGILVEQIKNSSPFLDPPPQLRFDAALAELREQERHKGDITGLTFARSQVTQLIRQQRIEPLLRAAEAAVNPTEKNLRFMQADLIEQIHLAYVAYRVTTNSVLDRPLSSVLDFQKAVMDLLDKTLEIENAIQQCTRSQSRQPLLRRANPFHQPSSVR